MSTNIDFKRVAFEIDTGVLEDRYIVCTLWGNNRRFDINNNIYKKWNFVEYGTEDEIIDVLKFYKDQIEGCMLKWGNGSILSLEHYQNKYRETIENAYQLESFFNIFSRAEEVIELDKHKSDNPENDIKQIENMIEIDEWNKEDTEDVLGEKVTWKRHLDDTEKLLACLHRDMDIKSTNSHLKLNRDCQ